MECPSCHKPVDGTERFCKNCGSPCPTASTEGADPLLGQILGGKFRVVKLLGEGGMGAVYEGEQQLGTKTRKVAIKTLHAELSRDPQIQARFQREVSTIAELEHPNTIQVYDFGSTPDGQLFLVMEFVQGMSLATTLEKGGPMDAKRADAILRQICGSLEEAHAHGIVHRDLKPDNVVLTERAGQKEFVKVLDFGIAKVDDGDPKEQKLTQAGMVLGTPPYMSPEQFIGKGIDLRSDIYSIAVMAYEMLTGKLPWTAETPGEWAVQHMTVAPYPIDQLPEAASASPAMRGAIMKALAKSPDDRFANLKDFYEAFSAGGKVASGTSLVDVQPGRVTFATSPEPMSGRGATMAAPAVPAAFGDASFAQGMPPAPMPLPPAPMHTAPTAASSGGGGRGIAIALIGLLVVGGGGAAIYFATSSRKPVDGALGDAGLAAVGPVDAGAKVKDQPDSALEPLSLDAGHDAAHPLVHWDAGGHVTPPPSKCPVPACGESETMRQMGRMKEANMLANQCRAAGCTP